MGLEILITVAIASGGAISSFYMILHGLERRLDDRLDRIELAIARKDNDVAMLSTRIERLEDHENQEARTLRTAISQIQQWVDIVASPVNVRTEP